MVLPDISEFQIMILNPHMNIGMRLKIFSLVVMNGQILNGNNRICLKNKVNDNPLYIYKFSFAEEFKTSKNLQESYKNINGIINQFLIKDC